MLDTPFIWRLATHMPWLLSGRALHRAALHAVASRAPRDAEALFEHAASRFRIELEVEALARLRVHQLIARARASGDPRRDAATCLEIEQRLTRLDRIESLEPPFELVPASRLLAGWILEPPAASSRSGPPVGPAAVPDAA